MPRAIAAVSLLRFVVPAVGGLWSLSLGAIGIHALVLGTATTAPVGFPMLILGWTLLAGAQLVFCSLVADRVFPIAGRRVGAAVELVSCLVLLAGLAVFALRTASLYAW
ncbi:MAG: hypothetical protein AAGI17_09955 [Planctomycetota bacterium]